MSAKLLYNLSDENPNLHKQIGCMNGIIQVFYRQHYPGRRVFSHGHRILLPGETSDQGSDFNSAMQKEMRLAGFQENTKRKAGKEKQRVSTEASSRPSFSPSPRSSSFSSADISTVSQCEVTAITHTKDCENTFRALTNGSPQLGNLDIMPCDLRDLVKGSIHREARSFSVKTASKDEVLPQQPISNRVSISPLKESPRSPSQSSREWNVGSRVAQLKDSPRLSYDERELRNDRHKRLAKPREPPRLSLDSRAKSFRSSRAEATPSFLSENMKGQQEPASRGRMSSSVVAKLMGLEVLPTNTATNQNEAVNHDSSSRPLVTSENGRKNRFCDSPRPSHVEAASLRSRNADSIKRTTAASKFPTKTDTRKEVEGAKGQLKTHAKAVDATLTVYGEIQKRLTHLEFKKSGKDLRALKQILEAMEKTKQLIDNNKDNGPNSASLAGNDSTLLQRSNQPIPAAALATIPWKNFGSPIVVMEPPQVFEETRNFTSPSLQKVALPNLLVDNSRQSRRVIQERQTAMARTPRLGHCKGQLDSIVKNNSARPSLSRQTSAESSPMKSNVTKSGRSQYNVGPRQQQNKIGFERQSRPTSATSEMSRLQRQHGRQQMESTSPRRKQGTKSRNLQQSDDLLSNQSSGPRSLGQHSDARSLRSDSNLSSVSNADIEITSKYRFDKTSEVSEQHTPKQRSPDLEFKQDKPALKPVNVTLEQPSPVSVLDAAFYEDESPSPVRKISTFFKEDDTLSCEDTECRNEDTNHAPTNFRRSNMLPENSRSFQHTNSDLDERFVDENAFPADIKTTDYEYISEILLASGILVDPEYSMICIQLHQSRLPINPDLFFVLEQNKTNNVILQEKQGGKGICQMKPTEKIRRKLVFDTVNEILAQRFVSEGCTKPQITTTPLMNRRSSGKHLLQTLCSEIDRLQAKNLVCSLDDNGDIIWENLKNQGMSQTEFEGETPAIVLDIERLIFKDLINEVLTSEVAAVRGKFSRHSRKLFTC